MIPPQNHQSEPRFSRRQTLLAAAALGCGFATGAVGQTAKPLQQKIRFGFSLYGMKQLPWAEALKVCASIGYDCVELALLAGYPTDPQQLGKTDRQALRKRLEDNKLSLAGLMENLPFSSAAAQHRRNLERLKHAIELANDLAANQLAPIETILGGRPGQWESIRGLLVEQLRDWVKLAAIANVPIAVKPHVGNAMRTPEAVRWLLDQIKSPWLKLAFDPSHFALQQIPLKTSAELLADTVFIHVKDAEGTPEKFRFLLPGEGNTDYTAYFKVLKGKEYQGPVVVEVSSMIFNQAGYDPKAAAERCYAKLAPCFVAAGLR